MLVKVTKLGLSGSEVSAQGSDHGTMADACAANCVLVPLSEPHEAEFTKPYLNKNDRMLVALATLKACPSLT